MKGNRIFLLSVAILLLFLAGCGQPRKADTSSPAAVKGQKQVTTSREDEQYISYKFMDPTGVKWMTMQGGLGINTKVLFRGNEINKIVKIVRMIDASVGERPSTQEEVAGVNSRARPVGILIQLENGETLFVCFAYKITRFAGGGVEYRPYDDKFVINYRNADRYVTAYSREVVDYLKNKWQKDMPVVQNMVTNKGLYRLGDSVTISGDGSTAPEVKIFIEKADAHEHYLVGRVPTRFGTWKWRGIVQKEFMTLDGRYARLNRGEYWFSAQVGEASFGTGRIVIE